MPPTMTSTTSASAPAFPLDAAFSLVSPSSGVALAVVGENETAFSHHKIEAAAAEEEQQQDNGHAAWGAAEGVAAVVGAAPFLTQAARSTWVAVPSPEARKFVKDPTNRGLGGVTGDQCYLWNPATDTILIPSGDGGGVQAFGPAGRFARGGAGKWEWRPLPGGEQGRLVWVSEWGTASVLACQEEADGQHFWRLVNESVGGEEVAATHLVCRRREWMGTWMPCIG